MTDLPWPELFTGPWTVTGNLAKAKVQQELYQRLARQPALRVLDVGCVGPLPFDLWEPLLTTLPIRLTGIDVAGIERAREVARRRGWEDRIALNTGSGYRLSRLFPADAFDLIVATQVLEHVAQPVPFLRELAACLAPGGEVFLTLDSAHWRSRYDLRHPLHILKNLVKRGAALVGNETHYDLPWRDNEVVSFAERAGLEVVACRYYNVAPLKFLHNHLLSPPRRNEFLRDWFSLEERLNEEAEVRSDGRGFFLNLFVHLRKPTSPRMPR